MAPLASTEGWEKGVRAGETAKRLQGRWKGQGTLSQRRSRERPSSSATPLRSPHWPQMPAVVLCIIRAMPSNFRKALRCWNR